LIDSLFLILSQITDNSRGNKKVLVNVATLKESIAKMKDSGKKISYLKVDIESSELDAIHEWIRYLVFIKSNPVDL